MFIVWCLPTISSPVIPFSYLQSFPSSGSFLRSQFVASGDQNIGASASASVIPMNTQDWFSLRLTGAQLFLWSNTHIQKWSLDILGGPKSSFGFLKKNKRHIFHFSPRTLLNNVFNALFHCLQQFFRQLHNSIFPKLLTFLSKELFQVPFPVFRGIETFSIKRILWRLK